ncbi:MAG: hypothetical protein CBD08_005690 [Cellvibrionales bacterium TMED148]|nr:hypothetical protein [Porticoccaceae bacterium]RPG89762.1 MAG: hypothetical protein CBD08_005690 [Cellvibrionales bacterium TMED148]
MAPEVGIGDWLSMMASLFLVICLLLATLYLIKQMSPGVRGGSGKRLRVSEVQHIGARQKLLLIQLNGDEILIGQTPQSMTLLGTWNIAEIADLRDKVSVVEGDENSSKAVSPEPSNFQSFIDQLLNRRKGKQ